MSPLLYSLLGALAISFISLIGIVALALKEKFLKKILILLISFSAGALLGAAYFHLLPESLELVENYSSVFEYLLVGFCLFFVLERILRWHHCHKVNCEVHPRHLGIINLIGDGLHNLIDGLIIYAAFSVSIFLGFSVLISIALHEIPQEIGDFGVLIYAGFSRARALFYNFLSAILALFGVLFGYFLSNNISNFNQFVIPFTAGGFIYIASSDLIPELHKEVSIKKSFLSFLIFLIALIFMMLVGK